MKNTKTNLILSLVVIAIALAWTSCEKNDKNVFKVNEFRVEPQSDTAPATVFLIEEITLKGAYELKYTYNGAHTQYDINSSIRNRVSTYGNTRKDTITLYYEIPGTYEVILEADGKTYSDSFTLQPPKTK